ncbi:serine/threonine-protein kinase [Frankia sp. QA3]|uniref:serine/threonine-protein kinase n=1 Tax=Frankia sp. QA3 TaxID=710111 RepID=UPI000269C606|nr:serine/threonine-protein kinase [Frankia sp. QA3]EIV94422.1 serine/threonine protein kinase [Frankia sp. QA3]
MLRPLTDTDPRMVGPYRLHNRIGAGGMGVVYLGFGDGEQPVAVKVPHEAYASDPEFRARFRSEVTAARHVRASTVARVINAEVEGPRPWLATEYVPGPTLHAAVLEHGPLVDRHLDGLTIGLAAALEAIHGAGVVHRDLKPANIVMSWAGPKVIDFGVARSAEYTGYTQAGELVGTIAWMSPEQLDGQTASPASDIFAWACCVVFAATGRRPFRGESQEIVALRIGAAEPELDGTPDRLLDSVSRCLAKDPAQRLPAGELVQLLTRRLSLPTTAVRSEALLAAPTTGAPLAPDSYPGEDRDRADHDETRLARQPGPPPTPPPTPSPRPGSTPGPRRLLPALPDLSGDPPPCAADDQPADDQPADDQPADDQAANAGAPQAGDASAGDASAAQAVTAGKGGPPAAPTAVRPAALPPGIMLALLAVGGLTGALGVWAAGTARAGHAVLGPAAATVIGAICAQMLFLSNRAIGVAITVLAAFAGSGGGVLLARALDVDEPGRVLLSVAVALVVATACAFAMMPSRPPTTEPHPVVPSDPGGGPASDPRASVQDADDVGRPLFRPAP